MARPSRLLSRWRRHATPGARPAVHDATGGHSYRAMDERAHRVASALLQGSGSLGGARVALLVSPGAAWVEAFFGVLLAGGCVVVLSPLHPAPESAYFLEDAAVETIIVSADLAARAAPLAGDRAVLAIEELCTRSVELFTPTSLGEDPALQLYTSGTTGRPKGAIISHEIGAKGIGEIGLVGCAAAIANGVYHATGKRIRDLPVTSDKLLST